jgi:Flp pilus assembly protein TadG
MSTSFAVIMPVLLLVIFGVIEAGIWWHGRHVAAQAADTATDIARSHNANLGRAQQAGRHVADVGGLQRVSVSVHRGQDRVTATATGRVPMPVDLGWGAISQTATAPTERITRP